MATASAAAEDSIKVTLLGTGTPILNVNRFGMSTLVEAGPHKLLFDAGTHRVVGGGIVGTGAGDLISEVCLAIEMGADAVDIGKTIHPHPTLGETVGMAAEVAHGSCTDMPAARR